MKPRWTVGQIGERLEVERETARGLVKFLEDRGYARAMGERRPASGLGRAEKVYEFAEGFHRMISEILGDADLT